MEEKKELDGVLENKIAFITGGANNIGKAVTKLFASEGAIVYFSDLDKNNGYKTEKDLRKEKLDVNFLPGDMTETEEIKRLTDIIKDNYGRIDILLNNVGGSYGDDLEEMDEASFLLDIELNLKSAVFSTKYSLSLLKKKGGGSVIFITSINALFGGFGAPIYSSSKNALHAFMKCMVSDYSRFNIRFNAICSGSVPGDSIGWQRFGDKKDTVLKKLKKIYPLGRYGRPEDIAKAAIFLASSDSSWVTGQYITVDGGLSAVGNLPVGKNWWDRD